MIELAKQTWKNPLFKHLSLDDILEQLGITHKDFRRELPAEDLYKPTPGMQHEIYLAALDGKNLESLSRAYRITRSQAIQAAYNPSRKVPLAYNMNLVEDIMHGTLTQATIADKYGISQARVSQLQAQLGKGRTRQYRKPFTEEEKQSLKEDFATGNFTPVELQAKYNISRTTFYKAIK